MVNILAKIFIKDSENVQDRKVRGAYGMLLAGATQILFGIMGKRWENTTRHAVNEYWVRPLEEETPKNAGKVEGGCYW